jgi:uncharacterized membrane protein HdeD (DUF308 family)
MDDSIIAAGVRSSSWAILLRGGLAVAFGVLLLASPGIGLAGLVLAFGIFAACDGVAALSTAVTHKRAGVSWGWWVVEGVISLGVAALAFVRPGVTILAIVLLIAFRAIALGMFEVGGAIAVPHLEHRWLLGLTGVVSVAFGVLLVLQPIVGSLAFVWVIGAYGIVVGVMLIGVAMRCLATGTRFQRRDDAFAR